MNTAIAPRFLFRWLLLALIALLPSSALAIELDETEQIKNVERQLAAALAKNDAETLAKLISEDWRFVGSDGATIGRDEMLGALRSGQLKFQSYELGALQVRVYGDAAVVIGSGVSKGHMGDEAFDERDVFTDVFVRRGGKWLCVSTHSTEVQK